MDTASAGYGCGSLVGPALRGKSASLRHTSKPSHESGSLRISALFRAASGAALSLVQGRLRPQGPGVKTVCGRKNREKCSWYWFFLFP